jgi:tetratricopeptide (TPR) repeat protein
MIGGPTPWPEIKDFMTREIAWAEERGIAFTAADGLLGLAYAQEAAGEIDEARTTLARLREIFGSLPGEVPQYGETYQLSGHVERTAGNTEGSLAFYDRSREIFDGIGNLSWWHGSTTSKAHALIALGRLDEAEAALAEIEARGLTGSPRTESAKLSAGSLIALGRGDTESAVQLGRRAVELANEASNLDSQGRARERLAEALIAAGDLAGGRAELEAAILAYSSKGASKHEQRAAHRLKSLGETPAV